MRFAVRHFVLGLLISMFFAGSATAQYMKITTDNPTDNTRLRASGTTILTITLDTNHDKNNTVQTCNSHSVANGCGSPATAQPLDMFGYTLTLKATAGGTVTWGTFTAADAAYTDSSPQTTSDTEVEINQFRPTGTVTNPGLATLGSIPVTVVTGNPGIAVQVGPGALNPFGFGTGFATDCDGFFFPNFYVVGDPTDPCGAVSGTAGDWFDWDGARPGQGTGNNPPTIAAPATATGAEGTALTPIVATAMDSDGADVLTISLTGTPPSFVSLSTTPGVSPNTGTVTGTPGFNDAGPYSINWHVTDGTDAANTSTSLTVTNTNRAPTLAQPTNMTVNEGSTAEQILTGSDPDNDALTFGISAGPAFMSLVSPDATHSTVRLVPNFTQSGTYNATVNVSDGQLPPLTDSKSFTITVNNTNRAPVLAQPSDMTVTAGATADQSITATDVDGDALTFTKTAGPTFLTVSTTTPGTGTGTGNIHLAPGAGDTGTFAATVQASDGTASNAKNLTITVNAGANNPPVLAQPSNMTVAEGATADQTLNATDADGDAITFTKVSGPAYATVTTTTPGTGTATGNLHLAPGFTDAGTATVTVQAADASSNNQKTLTVTVTNTNRAPTLDAIANMTVAQGATADQAVTGSDPDGDALTFSKLSGPTFMTVTTTNATTGNIHLAAGAAEPTGTTAGSVRATDGSLNSNVQPFSVTVTATNQAPTLAQPANMTVAEGATANQSLNATDPNGDALTFTLVSGPTYATVTTTTPGTGTGTGNLHLAPGFSDAGTAGATVQASDGSLNNQKSLTITVTNTNRAPTLTQPADMTVAEGATADQAITGSDPDGDALTFAKVSGPAYLTVTTTNGTTGNIHLAPGFSDAGTASATVSTTDGSLSDSKSLTVTVTNTNRAPTLNAVNDMTVTENDTADQSITGSDPDGDALTFAKVTGPAFMTVSTTNATTGSIHLAPAGGSAGTYNASASASDGTLSDTKSFLITVNPFVPGNTAPVLAQPSDMTVAENATADQAITATDADSDPLSFAKVSGPTFLTVTTTTPGTGTGTGNIHLAPGFSDAGTYSAAVLASDGSLTDSKSLTVTVTNVNRAPTLDTINPMTVTEGSTADQTITGSDPDGDALTFTKVTGPTFLTITTSTPTSGNVHVAPALGDQGVYTVQAQASDGTLSDTHIFQVTVNPFVQANRAPTLEQPADMTVAEGATADQSITGTDPDGDALSFAKVSGPGFLTVTTTTPGTGTGTGNIHLATGFTDAGTYAATVSVSDGSLSDSKSLTVTVTNTNRAPTLDAIADMTVTENATADQSITGSDPDGDALTFAKVTGPAFLTVSTTNPTTGNVHLAPGLGDAGTYSASASASDGTLSDTKAFTVTVNPFVAGNHAPVLEQPADMTVAEGATADQSITGTDQDGDALSFSKVSGPGFLTVTTTTPGTGTGTGNIHLAPGFTDAGTHAATVSVSDGSLSDSKSLTVTVTNTNRAPDLNPIANMTVTEGATADQSITGTDPDGDALTFAKVTGPAFLTVSTTNPTTGNVHLAPGAGTAGTYNASASATDGDLSDTESFMITVNAAQQNHAPVLTQPNDMTVDEGQTADQQLTATDQDGNNLTFSKVVGPTFETVGGTGNVHLAPGFGDAGTYSSTVRVSDGSLTDEKTFLITVNNVNRAPVADAGGPYTGAIGIAVNFSGTGSSDPDGDALTYSWDFDATNGIQSDATGATPSHTYATSGTFTVTLTVSDGTLSDTDTATATISESNVLAAFAFVDGGDKVIRLNNQRPFWCVNIRPVNNDFRLTDIIPSSVRLNFNGQSIPSLGKRSHEDEDEDGGRSIEFCFAKDRLRTLLAGVGNGRREVTLTITGDLQGGTSFLATLNVAVQKGGGPGALADEDGHGRGHDDAFAWASPNPLNPSTTISFALAQPGNVRLAVYDVSGRLVNTLANGYMQAGIHDIRWDGTSRTGSRVASGVYFYVLQTSERTVKSQLVVAK